MTVTDRADRGLRVRLKQTTPIPLDVEIDCAPGQVMALVGPSGSGKSTVLRAIAGLITVEQGWVQCNGQVWLDTRRGVRVTPQQRRVGMVFQHYALFPHLSALANVMEALCDAPQSERESRARDWLARVHLDSLVARLPAALSGGQQQRVALARALAREPHALLLDEPFSAVDRATRERLYRELAQLRQQLAMPAIFVTHDLDEALLLADRMCVLYQGRALQTGAPYEVMTQPRTAQVAQLVGLKNVFRAGVIGHDAKAGVTTLEWRRHRLQARLQDAFAAGTQVTWAIPQGQIVLQDVTQAESRDIQNPIRGKVIEMARLAANAIATIDVDGAGDPPLFASVPLHVAHQNQIRVGTNMLVSLLRDSIHLMPSDRQRRAREGEKAQPAANIIE